MVVGDVLPRVVRRVYVEQVDSAYSPGCVRRIHQHRTGWLGAFDGRLGDELEPPLRVRLPALHVGGVDARGVRHAISAFDDRGEQQIVVVLVEVPAFAPSLQLLARSVDPPRVLGSEVHPA